MTTNSDRASAQIIQFPARGRFASTNHSDERLATNSSTARIVIGGAWYHDEAIEEAARDRKN
jgi:Protein of unknown function (DUF2735)